MQKEGSASLHQADEPEDRRVRPLLQIRRHAQTVRGTGHTDTQDSPYASERGARTLPVKRRHISTGTADAFRNCRESAKNRSRQNRQAFKIHAPPAVTCCNRPACQTGTRGALRHRPAGGPSAHCPIAGESKCPFGAADAPVALIGSDYKKSYGIAIGGLRGTGGIERTSTVISFYFAAPLTPSGPS